MDIRQIIREELLRLEASEKPYVNNYGLPEWFNLLDHYKQLATKSSFSEEKLKELVQLMYSDIPDCNIRVNEYHKIISDWDINSY